MENETKPASQQVTAAELSQLLKESPNGIFLIDLMNKDDYVMSHVPGTVNIPVEELENRMAEIPRDKEVVVVCRRGLMKSDMALQKLQQSGFADAKKLTGGTVGWFESFPGNDS